MDSSIPQSSGNFSKYHSCGGLRRLAIREEPRTEVIDSRMAGEKGIKLTPGLEVRSGRNSLPCHHLLLLALVECSQGF
jgi:hypothetical protein